jgi:NAD-dependent deacetylase
MTEPRGADAEGLDRAAEDLRRVLREGGDVAVLTGAGVSAESGMPTFRGASNAAAGADRDDPNRPLWERYDPADLATPGAFEHDPALVSSWYRWRLGIVRRCEPNDGHRALVDLEERVRGAGGRFTLATQNVDGLHRRAGSGTRGGALLELHGSIETWTTPDKARSYAGPQLDGALAGEPPYRCPETGEPLRPGVVWFGEMLPEDAIGGAIDAARRCSLFIAAGTSATVQPAASLVGIAADAGAATIEVNAERTAATGVVDHALTGPSGALLPALLDAAARRG